MKKRGKAWYFPVLAIIILAFVFTAFFGIKTRYGDITKVWVKGASDIRFGIDIRGGVEVTFKPEGDYNATDAEMDGAKTVITDRLVNLGITDYDLYVDYNDDSIILQFPWQADEASFDPESAIEEIGTTAHMEFREGTDKDGALILDGEAVESASAGYGPVSSSSSEYYVALSFTSEGATAFAEATARLAQEAGSISIWLDDTCISTAKVNEAIADGKAVITNSQGFDQETVITLANQINSGALPFSLTADSYSTISPTLGENSLSAMVLAGVIAFACVAVFMILVYRLIGLIASVALLGQVAATLAFVSGYFGVFNSFTLTLPGIAGIILAIGMGVDANIITAERIKEELKSGKTLDGAINSGFSRGLAPIVDGNVTIVIVSIVLMGAFGPTDSFFARLLYPVFFAFGPSTTGTIYAFGYTLLTGVLLNFVFGVFATRAMLRGASRISLLRKPWLFGGAKKSEADVSTVAQTKAIALPAYKIDFASLRKRFVAVAGVLVGVILVLALVLGVSLDVEFKGGAMITLSYEGSVAESTVSDIAKEALDNAQATVRFGENSVTKQQSVTISLPGSETVTTDEVQALLAALEEACPENAFEQLSLSNVSATLGGKFLAKSVVAVVVALVLILLYIAVRFRKIGGWTAGVMSICALCIDLFVVFGAFVVMRSALDGNFIAAMLTILGYSINDTVVVYDRIRENRSLYGKNVAFLPLVNASINQSMRRTVLTTITTCIALGVMCIVSLAYGLSSIFHFVFPLMMGMISGVFTSLCVSTSLWMLWTGRKEK